MNEDKLNENMMEEEAGLTAEQKQSEQESGEKKSEEELLAQLKRLQAEFVNYKRRVEQQRVEWYDQAVKDVLLKLLPVLDDFDHLFLHLDESSEHISAHGVKLIYEKLLSTLKSLGLEQIEAEKNAFDPELHDAVHVEQSHETPDGHVMEVWQKGYKYKDKLLRPAKVKVAEAKK